MEDGLSCKSNDSITTIIDEYEVIAPEKTTTIIKPQLSTLSSTSHLQDLLSEAIHELASSATILHPSGTSLVVADIPAGLDLLSELSDIDEMDGLKTVTVSENQPIETTAPILSKSYRMVGGSKFYEVMKNDADVEDNFLSPTDSLSEKQDCMKPTDSDEEEVSDVDQECTMFSGVSYLGAAGINCPKSEAEIQKTMGLLSAQKESETGIAVSISIPVCSQGLVMLYDGETNSVMARYAVKRILFYAHGAAGTPVAACFAFTWSHGETRDTAMHQCHVFRCHIAEAVAQVSSCFAKAFERVPRSMTSSLVGSVVGELSCAPSMTSSIVEGPCSQPAPPMQLMHVLECTVDIRELDGKGSLVPVPKERLGFKLRGGIDKQVSITVQQVSHNKSSQGSDDQQVPATCTSGLIIERCFGILLAAGRNVKHSDMQLLEMVSGAAGGSSCSVCALWNAGEQPLAAFNVLTGDNPPTFMTMAVDLVIRGLPEPIRLVVETPVKIVAPSDRYWYSSKRPLVQQFFINLKENPDSYGNMQYEVASVEPSAELDRSRLNLTLTLSNLLPSPLGFQPAPPSPTEDEVSDGDEPLLSGTGEVSKDCCEGVLENWAHVLRSWSGSRPKALSHLVKLGVPEALRGEVWQRLAEADQHQHLMDTYRTLITKDCPFEGVIQRDIARTFPAHDHFREAGGLGQDSLLRVARAYAVYDVEVGYCQGLSFLAATLLLHMPEEQAFCVLVRLMYGYGLRELYKDGFEALYMRLHQLQRLMEEHMSDLRQHFENMGVEPHMFASQWFLTLFTARFPLPLVYHIVDVFLLQGADTLLQVALALLSKSKKDLLQHDFEGILKYFRVTLPKKCRAEEVSRQIVKHACSFKLKRLHKYQLEFENLTKETSEKEKVSQEMERLKTVNNQLMKDKEQVETQLSEARGDIEEALKESARNAAVARDYREICARLDRQLHELQDSVKKCASCSSKLTPADNKTGEGLAEAESELEKGSDRTEDGTDSKAVLQCRVRDLELELAQVKLAHVQAQCSNQELSHQLNSAITECQNATANQKSWSPWLTRTLGSIKEAAQNRPSFQTYLPTLASDQPSSPNSVHRRHGSVGDHKSINPAIRGSEHHAEPVGSPRMRRRDSYSGKRHSQVIQAGTEEGTQTKEKHLRRRSEEVGSKSEAVI